MFKGSALDFADNLRVGNMKVIFKNRAGAVVASQHEASGIDLAG